MDIVEEADGMNIATTKTFSAQVIDGALTISLYPITDEAHINGIAISPI